jgi:hypothetical protein
MQRVVKPRHHRSSKPSLLVILGAASCGAPSFGLGGDGSGSSGESGDAPGRWLTDGASEDVGRADPTDGADGATQADSSDGGDESTGEPASPSDSDGDPTSGPVASCTCAGAEAFPWVWTVDASAGTVRKLDADTMQAQAVYYTTGNGTVGRPASTAVSIDGRAVAVANRDGDVVKIWAQPALCNPNQNATAGLQTSIGDQVLPWAMEECVDWVRATDFTIQVPVAWGAGTLNPVSCEYDDQAVWTAGCNEASDAMSTALRMDSDTGVVTDEVVLSGFPCDSSVPTLGATDRDGAFWVASTVPGRSRLARISDAGVVTLLAEPPVVPAGLAIDSEGRVWLSARNGSGLSTAARYTPGAGIWDLAQNVVTHGQSGIVEDDSGRMWLNYESFAAAGSAPGGTFVIAETLQVGPPIVPPCAGGHCEGISIDFEGRIWSTSETDQRIYRFDPSTGEVLTLGGMGVSEYSSDMTGWALQNAACQGV